MPDFKIDFHHHCSSDPVDHLSYSDFELIDQAALVGLDAIAITPHGGLYKNDEAVAYARSKGILLIPGIEKMIEGHEIVLLNVRPGDVPETFSFDDLKRLREEKGSALFVFAPHPFYPRSTCAGPVLDKIAALIDAVEYAHLYFSFYNRPNEQAVEWALKNGKTVIANSDSHSLSMVGHNHSVISAAGLDAASLFSALKQEQPRLETRPYTVFDVLRFLKVALSLEFYQILKKIRLRKQSAPA